MMTDLTDPTEPIYGLRDLIGEALRTFPNDDGLPLFVAIPQPDGTHLVAPLRVAFVASAFDGLEEVAGIVCVGDDERIVVSARGAPM
jgi:hypothetical protein